MASKGCAHEDLEFLGSQRTEDGENKYFRCRRCGGVLVVTPQMKAYYVPGREGSTG
ncbi:MAG: hypothetical protein QXO17_07535 [Nitrososphaerota archaeon]|nr:hypothetical protein [Candidatus Calditenuis fumarioli]